MGNSYPRGKSEGLDIRLGGQLARHATVGDTVLSTLRSAIISGRLAPGEHLNQDALASSLGVSRMPVRSALMQLESEGLVSFHPYRGAVVRPLTTDQVREIYELRIVLEEYAIRQVTNSVSEERLDRLDKLAARMDKQKSGQRFFDLRSLFYRELYDAEARPLLVSILERLREDVGRYWARLRVTGGASGENNHTKLLDYVRAKDADAAAQWLCQHLERVRDELVSLIGQMEEEQSGVTGPGEK